MDEVQVDIEEHDDGSATVTVDADQDTISYLAGKGLEFLILMEIVGNPTLEDMINWIKNGRRED